MSKSGGNRSVVPRRRTVGVSLCHEDWGAVLAVLDYRSTSATIKRVAATIQRKLQMAESRERETFP